MKIDWEYIDDFEEYRVEIAADQNFEDLLGTFHGRQAPCFVPREFLEKKGVYYYRIQVREVDDGWSMFSRPEWFRIMETIEMKPVEPAIQICLVPDVNCRQDYTQRNDQTIKRQWYLVQLLAVSLGLIDSQSDLWIDVDAYQNIADLSHVKKLCNPLEYWELFLEESISCTGPAQSKIVSNETLATAGEEPNSEKINGYGTCNNNDL